MASEAAGGASLENVVFRLVDHLSEGGTDHYDTMIMISLVNLMGIISVINKQGPVAQAGSRPAGEDPLMGMLLKMLMDQQGRQGDQGGGPGLDPALLMSLMGARGQRPENALLMALLSSMLQRPAPPPQHREERQAQLPRREERPFQQPSYRREIRPASQPFRQEETSPAPLERDPEEEHLSPAPAASGEKRESPGARPEKDAARGAQGGAVRPGPVLSWDLRPGKNVTGG